MSYNKGKKFESRFQSDWERTVPKSTIDRIYDTQNYKKGVSNICDFFGFKKPCIYYLECKETKENTFNFAKLTQYNKLVEKIGIPGVRVGVVIWFSERDKVLYVPIKTIKKMKEDGLKSVNINNIFDSSYRYIDIPSKKLSKYMESDYKCLLDLRDGD